MIKITLATVAVLILLVSVALAQDAVPAEILQRTLFIKGSEYGTAFTVDYQGKMFIVTARHVVAGLPESKATIQVWQEDQWKDYHTIRTIFPASSDVDIAVFETEEKVVGPYQVTSGWETGGVTMGQQVWFLGYPYGISSRFSGGKRAPFIKKGTMSAIDGTRPDAVVIYIDGFNNPGFSGGPIVYWNFSTHSYGILGVVKGYQEETAKVLINGQHVDTQLLVNSGILVAYSVAHAMKAIEESQKQQPQPH
jgi:hypothetical protein